ncbi:MAG: ATP-binding cassette domain-containing protein [Clostridia bacterium]|nr:ATP-binding cassette domain-containing protein [Clostridia bacterium]
MDAFTIEHLSFCYPGQKTKAIDDLNLSVRHGEFLVLCGQSGCGKSTLLRQLKSALTPNGERIGTIMFEGTPLEKVSQRDQSEKIGFVQQNPDSQLVTDKVWHELAFGLESLGFETSVIRRRVSEMASFFGIQTWFYQDVSSLSGGQKQLLNLASIMVMQPCVLILDEPTSQLDPIAAGDFLAILGRINRELGTTVILTEHRLEDAFVYSSRVAVMERGRILCEGTAQEVGTHLKESENGMFLAMPASMRIWAAADSDAPCPVTVRDGKAWLADYLLHKPARPIPAEPRHTYENHTVIAAHELWFRYRKELPDVVKGLNLEVRRGEFLAILGGNGTGKTTSLKLLGSLLTPYRGEIEIHGSVGMLPQNPQTLFVKKTLREDLFEVLQGRNQTQAEKEAAVSRIVCLCRLQQLLDRHPYDLSGGEQQRAALAKVLLLEPDILLMDEPTKGLDAEFKELFAQILQTLLARSVTVIMVSHDIEFCARYAHRCAMFFDGTITADDTPRPFFSGNHFYTTAAGRLSRGLLSCAVTAEDVIAACGGALPAPPTLPESEDVLPPPAEETPDWKPKPLPVWRKLLAVLSGLAALYAFITAVRSTDLSSLISENGLKLSANAQMRPVLIFTAALILFAIAAGRRSKADTPVLREKQPLSGRTIFAVIISIVLIPLTLFVSIRILHNQKYYFTMLLVLLECMLPFFLVFEGKKPQARELVVIAVLCAIGVAGRAAFFMLPNFKPVLALTILAGVALGSETGFLVGAVTMLVSNMLFSQGPWTPWQMFAMGLAGCLAGLLFRRGGLRRSRILLCIFGAFYAVVFYGGIMNPAAALMWANTLDWKTLLAYYASGFPVDCVHAAATVLFLWFGAEPMLEKLERIKLKYGL